MLASCCIILATALCVLAVVYCIREIQKDADSKCEGKDFIKCGDCPFYEEKCTECVYERELLYGDDLK